MTRSDFTSQIAYDYAMFVREIKERHGLHAKVQPLDREYAFRSGQRIIDGGRYTPRVRHLDYRLIAREARKHLPHVDRLIREHDDDQSDDGYMTDVVLAAADGYTWS